MKNATLKLHAFYLCSILDYDRVFIAFEIYFSKFVLIAYERSKGR
jgi:hypothetical protein